MLAAASSFTTEIKEIPSQSCWNPALYCTFRGFICLLCPYAAFCREPGVTNGALISI